MKSIIGGALIALSVTLMAFRPADRELAAIEHALDYYLEGHATGDPAVMAQAFHESARLQFVTGGAYRTRSLAQYLAGLGGAPASDEAMRRRRVVSIDYTGVAAVAKIVLDYPGALITDYMQLLKFGDEWKIVNKTFTVEERSRSSSRE
jgi:hypothetical protein